MNRAVFFDRDGVLNQAIVRRGRSYAPLKLEEFTVESHAANVVDTVHRAGFLALVVTNQPEIARGQLEWATLMAMHERLTAAVPVDGIYVCPHDSTEGCGCHKPEPGLLRQAASDWKVDLSSSFIIGDRWRDIGAGRAAQCYTILLVRDYSGNVEADYRTQDLRCAVRHIITISVQRKGRS